MPQYMPPKTDWVREQVKLYESSGGKKGTELLDTGLPCIIVTHIGNKTGAIRKVPLMRVKDDDNYVLVGSKGGASDHPDWVHNLRANQDVEIRDATKVFKMRVREITDNMEYARLWHISTEVYPQYVDYQNKTSRKIPLFVAEPIVKGAVFGHWAY